MEFTVPADHKVKQEVTKERDKYLDIAREQKKNKLGNMKVTVIPSVNRILGRVTKDLVKRLDDLEIRERVQTIETTALLRSSRILRRILATCGDFLSFESNEKPLA